MIKNDFTNLIKKTLKKKAISKTLVIKSFQINEKLFGYYSFINKSSTAPYFIFQDTF
jgi:hypothetical protein